MKFLALRNIPNVYKKVTPLTCYHDNSFSLKIITWMMFTHGYNAKKNGMIIPLCGLIQDGWQGGGN